MKESIEYGIPMVTIYNEIDKIVESKTKPIQEKLDRALTRIDVLEENYCCRENCQLRLRLKKEARLINEIENETSGLHCKG